MGRHPRDPVVLTDGERKTLTGWTRSRSCPQSLVLRARIVLACEQEATNTAVAERVGTSVETVRTWRSRFVAEGLDGLAERPRPGRPPALTDDEFTRVIVDRLSPPPSGRRWSTRAMAETAGLSQTKVSRIWRTYRIQSSPKDVPHTADSPLPFRVRDLVGLHLAPPLRVLALAADDHPDPLTDHPRTPSTASGRPAEARELLAVANAFASIKGRDAHGTPHPPSPLLDFLDRLHRSVPAGMAVLLLAGGSDSSARGAVGAWLDGHPRFHWHTVAPTGSWIDDIDVLLSRGPLSDDNVLGFATSIDTLREGVRAWASEWTPSAQPFSWIKTRRVFWSGDRQQLGSINDSNSSKRDDALRAGADQAAISGGTKPPNTSDC